MNKIPEGAELLRKAVNILNYCRESFNDQFSAEELLKLVTIHLQSGWDFLPDEWTDRQINEALTHNRIPQWDDNERPIYPAKEVEAP